MSLFAEPLVVKTHHFIARQRPDVRCLGYSIKNANVSLIPIGGLTGFQLIYDRFRACPKTIILDSGHTQIQGWPNAMPWWIDFFH